MDNYNELYRKELTNQEIKSNTRIFKGFIWFVGFFFAVWIMTWFGIFEVDIVLVSLALGVSAAAFVAANAVYRF